MITWLGKPAALCGYEAFAATGTAPSKKTSKKKTSKGKQKGSSNAQSKSIMLRCRYLIQRDWSQEDSTSNEMRMHAMILLLLSTSMNDDADASSSVSIPDTS